MHFLQLTSRESQIKLVTESPSKLHDHHKHPVATRNYFSKNFRSFYMLRYVHIFHITNLNLHMQGYGYAYRQFKLINHILEEKVANTFRVGHFLHSCRSNHDGHRNIKTQYSRGHVYLAYINEDTRTEPDLTKKMHNYS